jgi:hypothetical protein
VGEVEEGVQGFSDGGVVADVEAGEEGGDGVEDDELAIFESAEGVLERAVALAIEPVFGARGHFAEVELIGEEMDFGEVGAVGEEARANDLGGIVFAGDEDDGAGRLRRESRRWRVESRTPIPGLPPMNRREPSLPLSTARLYSRQAGGGGKSVSEIVGDHFVGPGGGGGDSGGDVGGEEGFSLAGAGDEEGDLGEGDSAGPEPGDGGGSEGGEGGDGVGVVVVGHSFYPGRGFELMPFDGLRVEDNAPFDLAQGRPFGSDFDEPLFEPEPQSRRQSNRASGSKTTHNTPFDSAQGRRQRSALKWWERLLFNKCPRKSVLSRFLRIFSGASSEEANEDAGRDQWS